MFKKLILACIGLVLAQAAFATPPRWAQLKETILGQNDTHVFILRQIDDNPGYHSTLQTEIYLISRDLFTGADERIWPVMRINDRGGSFAQSGHAERVGNMGAGERVNPFDVLLWRGARNILPGKFPDDATWLSVQIVDEDIVLTAWEDKFIADRDLIFANLADSVARTRALFEPESERFDWEPLISGAFSAVQTRSLALEAGCSIGGFDIAVISGQEGLQPVLARLDCFLKEAQGEVSYWAVLPVPGG